MKPKVRNEYPIEVGRAGRIGPVLSRHCLYRAAIEPPRATISELCQSSKFVKASPCRPYLSSGHDFTEIHL
ncbi:hypothetical protein COLO4_03293 [Corchorus olitorius]|uniref:Uncharacterized protein n=1 Tax=Corchorus olitorius TaxID=93759 RepID=A0A1R3KZ08_9ROSI|nr:hypothetical protein COLO4_03293 [Corchorus olitorius]